MKPAVAFGDFVLDADARLLLRRGEPIRLTPKAFDFLHFVSEGTLTSLVAEVRTALGDTAKDAAFIRTVHRHGYAFRLDAFTSPA